MIPELNIFFEEAELEMQDAFEFLKRELSHIRAGKATPQLLDGVKVDYYGNSNTIKPISQCFSS